jgi:O-antigen ligase
LLAGVFAVLVVAFYAFSKRKLFIQQIIFCLLALASIFTYIYAPLIYTRTSLSGRLEQRSVAERMDGYANAWHIISEHAVCGVGIGNYTVWLQDLHPGLPGYTYEPVHMSFLLLLSEIGVVGVGLLLVVFLSLGYLLWQACICRWKLVLFGSVIMVILGFFDHYLVSSYVGLVSGGAVFMLIIRLACPQSLHNSPTEAKLR